MSDIDRLKELVGIMGNMPGDGNDLIAAHIDPDVMHRYAIECSHTLLHVSLGGANQPVHHDELLGVLTSAYLSAFALGCAWGKMNAGSGEK